MPRKKTSRAKSLKVKKPGVKATVLSEATTSRLAKAFAHQIQLVPKARQYSRQMARRKK